ncbi:MAG: hypothetical protein SHS37scaffold220_50 [Phage 67_12]|nr:MAG: hypothetical protein SHS37scaffold220_50 [Phage 67_12]
MTIKLVVTSDFADYKRGDQITDPDTVAAIRDSNNASSVVPVDVTDDDFVPVPLATSKS